MSITNIIVIIFLFIGTISLAIGIWKNRSSNFDSGSFITEIFLVIFGITLVMIALAIKFISSLIG